MNETKANDKANEASEPDYSSIICNMCGNPFTIFDYMMGDNRYDIFVNYPSNHDCERVQLNLCSNCFDKVFDMIVPLCKINPIVDDDWVEHCVSREDGHMVIHESWGPGGEGYLKMKEIKKAAEAYWLNLH